ncbi:MAG: CvpA family protein [Butyrivibrio sp.]|nr:CvpA family protein [Butyrivibrio sp.]
MELMNFVSQPQVLVSLAVLIILLWRISDGYRNGLITELLTIAALAVGFVAILVSTDTLNKFLKGDNLSIVATALKIAIIIVIYRAINGIAAGAKGIKNIPIVGGANKLLGGVFGIIETYIWVYVLNYIIGYDFASAIKFTIAGVVSVFKV